MKIFIIATLLIVLFWRLPWILGFILKALFVIWGCLWAMGMLLTFFAWLAYSTLTWPLRVVMPCWARIDGLVEDGFGWIDRNVLRLK